MTAVIAAIVITAVVSFGISGWVIAALVRSFEERAAAMVAPLFDARCKHCNGHQAATCTCTLPCGSPRCPALADCAPGQLTAELHALLDGEGGDGQ